MRDVKIEGRELKQFIPHAGEMQFITGVVSWGSDFESVVCRAVVRSGQVFDSEALGGVPIWVGFEYMAQTIAVLSGLERHLKGDSEPRIGYIIGVRKFSSHQDHLPIDVDLEIRVDQVLRDGPVVSFDCRIDVDAKEIATATINAYEPDRASE